MEAVKDENTFAVYYSPEYGFLHVAKPKNVQRASEFSKSIGRQFDWTLLYLCKTESEVRFFNIVAQLAYEVRMRPEMQTEAFKDMLLWMSEFNKSYHPLKGGDKS